MALCCLARMAGMNKSFRKLKVKRDGGVMLSQLLLNCITRRILVLVIGDSTDSGGETMQM